MFIGEYTHSMDEKGRVSIPSRFRQELKRGAVVTRGLDGALVLFPEAEWQKIAVRLASLPLSQANSRAFSRLMLAGAMRAEPDKLGRVIIPEYLRSYAGIKRQIIIAGLYNRVEIWDKTRWERYSKATEKKSGKIAEQLQVSGV